MNIVTLVNIFNCYGSILSMFPTNEKRKTVFSQRVKFGTEMSIWTKLIKSFLTEEELDMETLFWTFS